MNKKSFGQVKVKRATPSMDEVPDDCGYMQKFKYNIDMASRSQVVTSGRADVL